MPLYPIPVVPPQGDDDGADEAEPSGGRKKRAKKQYVPKTGTANYALLVTLYMVGCVGICVQSMSIRQAHGFVLSDDDPYWCIAMDG